MFDFKEIFTAGMVLFAVIDIIGSTPIIIGLRQKVGHIQSEKASLVAMIIMIVFLALEMILGIQLYKEESPETASIVPIAFPLIAGAGTLTSLLALRAEFAVVNIIVALVANLVVVYVVLKSSHRIEKILGNSGISVIRKVFGIILLAIAVKLFASNVQELF